MTDHTKSYRVTLKRLKRELTQIDRRRKSILTLIAGLEQHIELFGDDMPSTNGTPKRRRARSSELVSQAQTVLKELGKIVRIQGLIAEMQRRGYRADEAADKIRGSLVSALRRRDDVFSSPKRGWYGLAEWSAEDDQPKDVPF